MRLAPKLLSAGLVALSSWPSDAYQTEQLRGLPVVGNNNGDGRCRDGEECERERVVCVWSCCFCDPVRYTTITRCTPCVASCPGVVLGYM